MESNAVDVYAAKERLCRDMRLLECLCRWHACVRNCKTDGHDESGGCGAAAGASE